MEKCILYTRVSSQEQAEGYSIDAQLNLLRDYAMKKDLTIVKEFQDKESAKRGSARKGFYSMLDFIQDNGVKTVLCEKVDRFSRNFKDAQVIEDSGIILGGRDGKLRRLNDLAENDCGTTFETYVVVGPIPLARDSNVGILHSIDAVMADGSGPVTWAVVGALTFEGAISGSASDTGTWNEELNSTVHPACRGQAMSLKITGTAGRKWAVETITTSAKPAGRRRIS